MKTSGNHTSPAAQASPAAQDDEAAPGPFPGEPGEAALIARMIRVNHAGEFGAGCIYDGQLFVFGASHPMASTLQHMAGQEKVHEEAFASLIVERGVRPSLLLPLWEVAGLALGALTALMGTRAAMACTAAVEEVIDHHYAHQERQLERLGSEEALARLIARFRAEEIEHRDLAYDHEAALAPAWPLMRAVIATGSRIAIRLSQRL